MFKVTVKYNNGARLDITHINSISYENNGRQVTVVKGNELLTHCFPLKHDLSLQGENINSSVSVDGACKLEITPE